MKPVKKSIKTALVLFLSVGLFACGSSGGGTSNPKDNVKTGVFLDSPVSGISFATATQSGKTNKAGEFKYVDGEEVTFSIGGIKLPPAKAASVVTPREMAALAGDPAVLNILRILQTLDSDGDPNNGIQISLATLNAAANQLLDFTQATTAFESDAASVLTVLSAPPLVSSAVASAHFDSSRLQQMVGSYSGTFANDAGGPGGTWQMSIDGAGVISGTIVDSSEPAGTPQDSLSGNVLADGSTTVGVTGGNGTFEGTLTLDGRISGTWASTDPVESGTFTGSRNSGFTAATVPGVYVVIDDPSPGRPSVTSVLTFSANGTGVADWGDDPVNENFTWSVDAGVLIIHLANNATGTLPDRVTLTSGTINSGRFSAQIDDDPADGVYDTGRFTGTIARGSASSAGSTTTPATGGTGGSTVASLACNFETPWDSVNDRPASFNSFTEFQGVVANCGGALQKTNADIIGTWIFSGTEADGSTLQETTVFNANGTGNWTDTINGAVVASGSFNWSLRPDKLFELSDGTGKGIIAFTSSGIKSYNEETTWGSDLILNGTKDGEITTERSVKQ